MNDKELFQVLRNETPYLPDNGFSGRIMQELPVRRRLRMQVLGFSFITACICSFSIWIAVAHAGSLAPPASPVALTTTALAFWAFVAILAYVTIDERVFEF